MERVIVALDFPDGESALRFVDEAGGRLTWYKVGLQLYLSEGESIVRKLKERGKKVFLDLKLHDIPNTVKGAVRAISRLGVDMITVHATGGGDMIRAAREGAGDADMIIVAVTILTSLSHEDLVSFGYSLDTVSIVKNLSEISLTAGADGIVCSPLEVGYLKNNLNGTFIAVTPGIRFSEDAAGDQKRVSTPEEAIAAGADYIVMGRSLTAAGNLRERLDQLGSIPFPRP
ncbi:MAG: orotidine-5'-phosphate decarboxylase [Deltaproteobacteria bacterium]|nr:MAG: orotidine-5'-phosphate decarboxylase [Deltaproteobacteria bacterium]